MLSWEKMQSCKFPKKNFWKYKKWYAGSFPPILDFTMKEKYYKATSKEKDCLKKFREKKLSRGKKLPRIWGVAKLPGEVASPRVGYQKTHKIQTLNL